MSIVVTLGNGGNTATFSTVDTLISGTGADTIDFTGILSNASIDLGTGADVLTLGDLGTEAGMLGGINAIIVGNYLTTLGRPADRDLDMLGRLKMPIKALSATL